MENITLDVSDLGLKVLNEKCQLIHFINYSRLVSIGAGYNYICFDSGYSGKFVVPMEDYKECQKWLEFFEAKGLGSLIDKSLETRTLFICKNVINEQIIFTDTGFYAVNEQGFAGKGFGYSEFQTYERISKNTIILSGCDGMYQIYLELKDEHDARIVEEFVCFKYIGEWED